MIDCGVCGKGFKTNEEYKNHVEQAHEAMNDTYSEAFCKANEEFKEEEHPRDGGKFTTKGGGGTSNTEKPKEKRFTLKQYKRNEDVNNHDKNAQLLIKQYGTPEELEEINTILKRNPDGYSGVDGHTDYQRRYEISNKYYGNLLKDDLKGESKASEVNWRDIGDKTVIDKGSHYELEDGTLIDWSSYDADSAQKHLAFVSGRESKANEAKIPSGDLYQYGQKVGTITDYNPKKHEGYVTLDGIGIKEFGAMTSDYEVRVNGERIPNKWDGKHDYNLDLFGESKATEQSAQDKWNEIGFMERREILKRAGHDGLGYANSDFIMLPSDVIDDINVQLLDITDWRKEKVGESKADEWARVTGGPQFFNYVEVGDNEFKCSACGKVVTIDEGGAPVMRQHLNNEHNANLTESSESKAREVNWRDIGDKKVIDKGNYYETEDGTPIDWSSYDAQDAQWFLSQKAKEVKANEGGLGSGRKPESELGMHPSMKKYLNTKKYKISPKYGLDESEANEDDMDDLQYKQQFGHDWRDDKARKEKKEQGKEWGDYDITCPQCEGKGCPHCKGTGKITYTSYTVNPDKLEESGARGLSSQEQPLRKVDALSESWGILDKERKAQVFESLGINQGTAYTLANLDWYNLSPQLKMEASEAYAKEENELTINNDEDLYALHKGLMDKPIKDDKEKEINENYADIYNIEKNHLSPDYKKKALECSRCNEKFYNNKERDIHFNEFHATEQEYHLDDECPYCKEKIKEPETLDWHMEQEHGAHIPSQYTQTGIQGAMTGTDFDKLDDDYYSEAFDSDWACPRCGNKKVTIKKDEYGNPTGRSCPKCGLGNESKANEENPNHADDGKFSSGGGSSGLNDSHKKALDRYIEKHGKEDYNVIGSLGGWDEGVHLPSDILKQVKGADHDEMLNYIQSKVSNEAKQGISGTYLHNGQVIGSVEDFKPRNWFGKVTLNGMEDFSEYGTLEPDCTVQGDDGKTYSYTNRAGESKANEEKPEQLKENWEEEFEGDEITCKKCDGTGHSRLDPRSLCARCKGTGKSRPTDEKATESKWRVNTITHGKINVDLGKDANEDDALNAIKRMYFDDGYINDSDVLSASKLSDESINHFGKNQTCSICGKDFTLTGASADYGLGSHDTEGNTIVRNERLDQLAHYDCVEATGEDMSPLGEVYANESSFEDGFYTPYEMRAIYGYNTEDPDAWSHYRCKTCGNDSFTWEDKQEMIEHQRKHQMIESKATEGVFEDNFKSEYVMDQDGMYKCKKCSAWLDIYNIGSFSPEEVAKHHMKTEHGGAMEAKANELNWTHFGHISDPSFRTNCTDGEPHIPKNDKQNDTCIKCGKDIRETGEASGYWFTDEDNRNWNKAYNNESIATEWSTGISSNDPTAIAQLEAKLTRLEDEKTEIKARPITPRDFSFSPEDSRGFELTNINANIRSVKQRIEDLKSRTGESKANEDGGYANFGKKPKEESWSVLTVGSDLWYFNSEQEARDYVKNFPEGTYQINRPREGRESYADEYSDDTILRALPTPDANTEGLPIHAGGAYWRCDLCDYKTYAGPTNLFANADPIKPHLRDVHGISESFATEKGETYIFMWRAMSEGQKEQMLIDVGIDDLSAKNIRWEELPEDYKDSLKVKMNQLFRDTASDESYANEISGEFTRECPHCEKLINVDKLNDHIKKEHSKANEEDVHPKGWDKRKPDIGGYDPELDVDDPPRRRDKRQPEIGGYDPELDYDG